MNEIALRLASRIFDQRLIENQYRSAFIEEMIGPYLAPHGWRYAGGDWNGWDFVRSDNSRLEVKQSAANQTWAQKLPTRGSFDIAARQGSYDGPRYTKSPGRNAHTYLFAWNPIYGPEADHRNPDQWEFYVVLATLLPDRQKTIVLSKIKLMAVPVRLGQLCEAIQQVAVAIPPTSVV